jgi:hypothetical protein
MLVGSSFLMQDGSSGAEGNPRGYICEVVLLAWFGL